MYSTRSRFHDFNSPSPCCFYRTSSDFEHGSNSCLLSMHPRTTLNRIGERTVNIRASSSSTLRITAAFTVSAVGFKLPSMIIFKGKPEGRIVREFSSYPEGAVYACQDNAW